MAEPLTDELREQAAEYVLGTLAGEDRRSFERLLADNPSLRTEIAAWEARLVGLTDATSPVRPPQRVWLAIEDAIAPSTDADPHQRRRGWTHSLALWRGLALAALLALVVITVPPLLTPPAPRVPEPVYNLVVRDDAARPLWMVACDWRTRTYEVTRVAAGAPVDGKSHELWLVPADGGTPMSLGLIDRDTFTAALPAAATWRSAKAFAVSLEPAGGSPTGAPTGPVLHVAAVPG